MHSVGRGNGTPKDRDEVNRRDVYEFFKQQCFVYNASLKRELKINPMYEFRFDERLKTKVEESTRLACTPWRVRCVSMCS